MSDVRRQELRCTSCDGTFRFSLDFDQDGNHQVDCPGCGHTHYRVIVNGKITEERFDPNPGYSTFVATGYHLVSTASTDCSYDTGYSGTGTTSAGTGDIFLRNSWLNSSTTS